MLPDLEVGAVLLIVPEADLEIVLSPASAVDMLLKVVAALHRLNWDAGEREP